MPRPLYLWKSRYPLYRRLGGLQDRYKRVGKMSQPTGIPSPDRPVRSASHYVDVIRPTAQDKDEWQDPVNTKMSFRVSKKVGEYEYVLFSTEVDSWEEKQPLRYEYLTLHTFRTAERTTKE